MISLSTILLIIYCLVSILIVNKYDKEAWKITGWPPSFIENAVIALIWPILFVMFIFWEIFEFIKTTKIV